MTEIFVFGSNLAGRHGKGAALFAKKHHGAIYGQGVGLQGNSYAIPTKGRNLETLSLNVIYAYVIDFKGCANYRPDLTFRVTPIGCGLAGYKSKNIAWMFKNSPPNVILPQEFIMENELPMEDFAIPMEEASFVPGLTNKQLLAIADDYDNITEEELAD